MEKAFMSFELDDEPSAHHMWQAKEDWASSTIPLDLAIRANKTDSGPIHRHTYSYGFPQGKVALYFYPASPTNPVLDPYDWEEAWERCSKMPKKSHTLSLSVLPKVPVDESEMRKQLSPKMPKTPFRKPWKKNTDALPPQESEKQGQSGRNGDSLPIAAIPRSPSYSKLPPLPTSPMGSPKEQDTGRSFFNNYKASKSSAKIKPSETIRQVSQQDGGSSVRSTSTGDSKNSERPMARRAGSYGDLIQASKSDASSTPASSQQENLIARRPVGAPPRSESSDYVSNGTDKRMKNKPKPFAHLLGRTRSIKVDAGQGQPAPKTSTPNRFMDFESADEEQGEELGALTAPLQHDKDRSFRDMMNSSMPNRKPSGVDSENESIASLRETGKPPSTSREGSGAAFLSNLKSSGSKAADGIGKAGKGFFGKFTRSGSAGETEKVVEDENYICTVINLPLVEQTRLTRISKRLEYSRDKTEFWMPSLPWRCIDYLNDKGCEEEGLYRIPGSGPRVKEWQKKFDTELDVNLFNEPDLYDINIIGSMFKAWLRELPDEIFPKATQARIAEKCMGATETPQMLKDELSKLPPFNYYLLFAITCHLSLLHSFVGKNKMDYRNLCICFQPCLKIDGFCFQFLVCDWKNCWQGCWTEKDALMEEYRVLDGHSPSSGKIPRQIIVDERAVSSSESSQPSMVANHTADERQTIPTSTNGITIDFDSPTASDFQEMERSEHVPTQPLQPLSPITPLSPMRL